MERSETTAKSFLRIAWLASGGFLMDFAASAARPMVNGILRHLTYGATNLHI